MTIIFGNVADAFTQDLMTTDELKTGVRLGRHDRQESLMPQHVLDAYFLSRKHKGPDGNPARVPIGDGNVLLAAENSDLALYVGLYSKRNVGFGVTVETGGTRDRNGEKFVDELYFPAERRDGWVYGYIDRSDDGKRLRVKSKSALGDAAQSLWKVRVTLWPITKWEGNGKLHDADEVVTQTRSGNVGTGGLTTGQTVGDRTTARHTRVVEFDQARRNYQTFHIMTGSDDEVRVPVQRKP